MDFENIWIVLCEGRGDGQCGEDYVLNFETGTGAVCEAGQDIGDVADSLSAEAGVISVEPCRSLARTVFFDIIEDDASGFSLVDVSGIDYSDETPLTTENFSSVSIPMSVVRSATFEYTNGDSPVVIHYHLGRFATDSQTGLTIIAKELAPRFVNK
jgi:hypothetical protein